MDFPETVEAAPACSLPPAPGPSSRRGLRGPRTPLSCRAAAQRDSARPRPSFRFSLRAVIGREHSGGCALPSPPPSADRRGWARGPAAGRWRREKRPKEEGRARKREGGRAIAARESERAREPRQPAAAERSERARGRGKRGSERGGDRARSLLRKVPTSRETVPGAHRPGTGQSQRAFGILGKKVGFPPSPVPFPLLRILIKKKNNNSNSKLAVIPFAPHSWHHEGGRRSQTDSHHHQDGEGRSGAFPFPG